MPMIKSTDDGPGEEVLVGDAERTSQTSSSTSGYVEASTLARNQNSEVRRSLAANTNTAPEILYFLAEDAHPEVRRAIANNPASPRQADIVLAGDSQASVRLDLARKISRLAPDLSRHEKAQLETLTLEALGLLAADVLPRVRQVIAEELKTLDNVPAEMMLLLARDVELVVAAPVLEYSPLLDDDSLLEIINSSPVQGALSAISRRQGLAAPLCDGIVANNDTEAVAELLANPSAQIREETLDELIDRASSRKPWHRPLVLRPELSKSAVDRIARFVSSSLISGLQDANLLSAAMAEAVSDRVGDRLTEDEGDDAADGAAGADDEPTERDAAQDVAALFDEDGLSDENICERIDQNDRDFAIHALSHLTEIEFAEIQNFLHTGSAIDVVAICWHAGVSMRTAIEYQIKVARMPTNDVIYAKTGIDYPRSPAALKRRLEQFLA